MRETVKKKDIMEGFLKLGITRSDILEVHSSLSSFGYVEGGEYTIIEALIESVGNDGSIFMPALRLSKDLPITEDDKKMGITRKIKVIDADAPSSAMGIIADTFREMKDVDIGEGIFRIAAWGKNKDECKNGLNYAINNNGYALMLGVDIYSLTAMHYVEHLLPQGIKDVFKPTKEAEKIYPSEEWFIECGIPPVHPWYIIQDMAYKNGYIHETMIGKCKCMYFNIEKVIGLYAEELRKDPFALYGMEIR